MGYCKTALIKELKAEVKIKSTYIPPDWDGVSYNNWAKEIIHRQQPEPKPLRKVSEHY